MTIRSYNPKDYSKLRELYLDSDTYGGQFSEARDGEERLRRKIEADPDAILVAEVDGEIVGSVSLIDDGRIAWLFRFAVRDQDMEVAQALRDEALKILKSRGHSEVLVYTPAGNETLYNHYEQLGFNRGEDYTCYWQGI